MHFDKHYMPESVSERWRYIGLQCTGNAVAPEIVMLVFGTTKFLNKQLFGLPVETIPLMEPQILFCLMNAAISVWSANVTSMSLQEPNKVPEQTVVWVASRDNPINGTSHISL
ncbi:hypothetical protein Adt_36244 [Abeliophyllum distichum]|uniref:Uncharacterized protein n=1 Tax=Abeliophyllum distichum TaxID=126358 RepID=A0ABD1QIX9_9LAMI